MRTQLAWTWTLIAGAWALGSPSAFGQQAGPGARPAPGRTAPAAPAAAPASAPAAPGQAIDHKAAWEKMNKLMAEWEVRSSKVKSIYVAFDRVDESVAWGKKYYKGSAILKSPDLACLEFRRCVMGPDEKPVMKPDAAGKPQMQMEKDPSERIVCTGKEVLQYEWDDKSIFIYPLDPESRKKALQQGPLPFLFNMKAAEAKARYTMSVLKENDQEYLIHVLPIEQIDRKSFEYALLWLRKDNYLPSKLRLYLTDGNERQEFSFTAVQANKVVPDEYFQPALKPGPGWQVKRNEEGKDQPRTATPASTKGRPVQKPAMRPTNPPR